MNFGVQTGSNPRKSDPDHPTKTVGSAALTVIVYKLGVDISLAHGYMRQHNPSPLTKRKVEKKMSTNPFFRLL